MKESKRAIRIKEFNYIKKYVQPILYDEKYDCSLFWILHLTQYPRTRKRAIQQMRELYKRVKTINNDWSKL